MSDQKEPVGGVALSARDNSEALVVDVTAVDGAASLDDATLEQRIHEVRDERSRNERKALYGCALVALAALVWVTLPVGVGIFLGTLLAFTLQPFYEWLGGKVRRGTAALITVLASGLVVMGTLSGLSYLFVGRGFTFAQTLIAELGPGGKANQLVEKGSPLLARAGMTPEDLTTRLRDAATEYASKAAMLAGSVLAATATMLLALFFAAMTMFVILRNWGTVRTKAQEILPLKPEHTRLLLDDFQRIGRTTLLGTIVTGVAQGALATLGYLITGVSSPIFFGIATAVGSLVPAVGTLLIWVPIGIFQLLTGHVAMGVIELLWGAVVTVGISDYVIRPRLVGGEDEIPSVIVFVGLFGGVEVFGLKGLILGPVIVSFAISVLQVYAREQQKIRRT